MTPQPNQQVPIAFIDRTGYVAPFNGIMDRTLDGWYIYDQATLDKALAQQRRLEEDRVRNEIGIIDVQYSINEEDTVNGTGDDTPAFIQEVLGVDKSVPFLNLGAPEPEKDLPVGQVPEIAPPPPVPVQTATVDHLHVSPDNVNLTQEQLDEIAENALNPNQVAAAIMGL